MASLNQCLWLVDKSFIFQYFCGKLIFLSFSIEISQCMVYMIKVFTFILMDVKNHKKNMTNLNNIKQKCGYILVNIYKLACETFCRTISSFLWSMDEIAIFVETSERKETGTCHRIQIAAKM